MPMGVWVLLTVEIIDQLHRDVKCFTKAVGFAFLYIERQQNLIVLQKHQCNVTDNRKRDK